MKVDKYYIPFNILTRQGVCYLDVPDIGIFTYSMRDNHPIEFLPVESEKHHNLLEILNGVDSDFKKKECECPDMEVLLTANWGKEAYNTFLKEASKISVLFAEANAAFDAENASIIKRNEI
ncbi:MAG: hypothetical protein ABIH72_04030 [archaeon]